jgi:hypothetical protein
VILVTFAGLALLRRHLPPLRVPRF